MVSAQERALAIGIVNAGPNVGNVVASLIVPGLAAYFGWRGAFLATGALGFVWLAFWWGLYRQSAPISVEREKRVPWLRLFRVPECWAFAVPRFMSDAIFWFFVMWLPKYLQETFHLALGDLVWPTVVVYNCASLGSIAGGWLSSAFLRHGWTVNKSRKMAMLICACCALPVFQVPFAHHLWIAVAIIGLATAAHQGFHANLYAVVSDIFEPDAIGSVVGIGGTAGSTGAVLFQITTG